MTPAPFRHSREPWALLHAALVTIAAAWMFGGKIWWAKPILCWLVTPALLLTLWEYGARRARASPDALAPFRWLLPMAALACLVVVSAFIANVERRTFAGESLLFVRPLSPIWPSSADGGKSLRELWLLLGCYLTGFNLFVCVRTRHGLCAWMLVLAANAFVLAVFGTLQKLTGQDIFFGLQHAPNPAFFATFIYHNHWGAFTVLMTTLCLGLVFHYALRSRIQAFWHSPASGGVLATFLIAATVPLSTSRSSTLLIAALLLFALVHATLYLIRERRRQHRPSAGVVLSLLTAVALGVGAIYKLGEGTIATRLATTRAQIAAMQASGDIGQRHVLYRDTWRMSAEKPWFGWGLDSYERVFPLYNSTPRSSVDNLPISYQDAHSDWLQSLAEVGFIGTALLFAAVIWPLAHHRRTSWRQPAALYPLIGCAGVALYAWVEFPIANPAVVAAWWGCFFAGLRYAVLSEDKRCSQSSS